MYRSGNPALNDSTFQKSAYKDAPWWEGYESNMMTIEGVAEKTGLLLLITATTALFTAFSMPDSAPLILVGAFGGLIVALIVIFSGSTNPMLICTYAALEGLVIGGITWFSKWASTFQDRNPSSFPHLHDSRINDCDLQSRPNQVGQESSDSVYSSMFAIILIYIFSIIGAVTGLFQVPYIHDATPVG